MTDSSLWGVDNTKRRSIVGDFAEVADAFARTWGATPSTIDLLHLAAVIEPTAIAVEGYNGGVAFDALHARASLLAGVLERQGLDRDAAVGAALAPTIRPGTPPAEVAAGTRAAADRARASAVEIAGTVDFGSLPGIFRASARLFGNRIALTDTSGVELTYAQLDERSDDLAAGLIALGAGPERLVGVALPRGVELIVALLAVVKTGAAYLPLDQSHPKQRLAAIIADADPVLILTDHATIAAWADEPAAKLDTAKMDTVEGVVAAGDPTARALIPAEVHGAHPAYVMYTSGSTGKPKGVSVTHAAVVSLLSAMAREYDFSADDVWTMFQSYAFDVSVGEIWVALAFGGRLVVLDYLTTRTPERFVDVLADQSVTVVNLTPSAFYQLAGAVRSPDGPPMPPSVRTMIFVGEALDFDQVRRWFGDRRRRGETSPQLNNMYGPTEATVYLTRRELSEGFVGQTLASDAGLALPGSRMYVLDPQLRHRPDGVPGDLYLAGDQLARGYRGVGQTVTRFVSDPFGEPGDRMYRTGDVALLRNGCLEFLGRADDQVKLRGYRIELGDVEAALASAPGVSAAAAAIKSPADSPDRLIGYVVGVPGDAALDPLDVRRWAATRVPDYMVPDFVVVLDRLPLNVNGKLDRSALPDAVATATAQAVAPRSDVEETLAAIFADVLGLDEISVVESVFDVGGNSLLAARIVARACDELGVDLNLRDLFEAPTARLLAERAGHVGAGIEPISVVVPRPHRIPLSFAQQRMWFINQFDPDDAAYNLPVVVRLTGDVDVAALRSAVADVVARHEILRTTFPADDGVPHQVVGAAEDAGAQLDWAIVDSAAELFAQVRRGFDVGAQWPVRARLTGVDGDAWLLAVVLHHIGADGLSLRPLVADVVAAYAARAAGKAPQFAPLPVQFADFAMWQHRVLGSPADDDSVAGQQLSFWRQRLAGLPEVLDLPADRPRPLLASHRGAAVEFDVAAEVGDRVARVASAHGVTPFMVVHAALAVLLSRLSATRDIVVASPVAGRGQAVLEPLVGMFVNTLVLRTAVDPSASFAELLSVVRGVDLDAFAHADVPFEAVVESVDPVRSQAFSPLAQVMLSFDPAGSVEDVAVPVAGVTFAHEPAPVAASQWDLSFVLTTSEAAAWSGSLIYATDLFDEKTARTTVDRFVRLIDALTSQPTAAVGAAQWLTPSELAHAGSTGPVVAVPAVTLADLIGGVGRGD
ncbi:amino acid adenylation domain-containing protein, partial [Gordonia sp. TBRC 11910]